MIIVVSVFGGHFVYAVNGLDMNGVDTVSDVGFLGMNVLGWAWNTIHFMFGMITFSIPGMPGFMSGLFLFISLCYVWIIARFIRGTS